MIIKIKKVPMSGCRKINPDIAPKTTKNGRKPECQLFISLFPRSLNHAERYIKKANFAISDGCTETPKMLIQLFAPVPWLSPIPGTKTNINKAILPIKIIQANFFQS